MATATLSRDGTSVEIPLLADGSGSPLVIRGIGKPNIDIQSTGAVNPRSADFWSGLEQYTLSGRLFDYSKVSTLLDLIKSGNNGNSTLLNVDMPDYDTDIKVAPAAGQDQAVTVVYPPGYEEYVEVDLSLTRISETINAIDQPATTPTASGSGPIQLSDGSTTVDLTADVEIQRSVGRPQSVVRRNPSGRYPRHIDKFKTAYDGFELSFEFVENTVSKTNDVVELFAQQLGRNTLTLDFNGEFGLGSFAVVPDGSEAVRHNRQSGYKSSGVIPQVSLRRVLDPTA